MAYEVIYHAEPEWAEQAKRLLMKHGLDPFYVEKPTPTILQKSAGTYKLHLAVPTAQAAAARLALEAWKVEAEHRAGPLQQAISRQLLMVFGVPVGILIAWRVASGRPLSAVPIAVALVALVALVAYYARIQRIAMRQRNNDR